MKGDHTTRTCRHYHQEYLTMGITRSDSTEESCTRNPPPPERRMCVDFRRLNSKLPKVQNTSGGKGCISLVPLPKIDELYAKLKGHKYFSTLDLRSGYYHIGLSESAKPKTAFVVSGMGKYQFNRVPFGLAQAPAYFQRLINEVLTDIDFAMGYLDDIIIFSETEEEHL